MNRFTSILIFIYAFTFFLPFSEAQVFRNFSGIEGVSIADTRGIAQDQEGFIWFATTSGLVRYDSRTFKRYVNDPDNPNSVASDDLRDVFCDSKGNVWVGGTGGLDLYNRDTDGFIHFEHDSSRIKANINNLIYCIGEDSDHTILAGTPFGLNKLTMEGGLFRKSSHLQDKLEGRTEDIRCITQDANGDLWAGTYDGLVYIPKNEEKLKVYKRKADIKSPLANEFVAIYADNNGAIWLGSNQRGLIRFDVTTEKFQLISDFKDKEGHLPVVNKIMADERGNFWMATESGLAYLDPVSYQSHWYVHQPEHPYSLADNTLYSMCSDSQGGIWLGSYYQGISYFNTKAPGFTKWPLPDGSTLDRTFLNPWMGKSKNGNLWLIPGDLREIRLCNPSGEVIKSHKLKLTAAASYNYFYVDGEDILWAGGNSILTGIDLKTGAVRDYPMIVRGGENRVKGRVHEMMEDSQGRLWLIGPFGALHFDRKSTQFTRYKSVSYSNSIFEDSRQNIWIGGGDEVFFMKYGGTDFEEIFTDKPPVSSNFAAVWSIAEDQSGRVWAGTRQGLQLFNPVTNRFDIDRFVPFERVWNILIDRNGYFWLTSDSRLIRYHPEKKRVQTYSYHDGLPSNGLIREASGIVDSDDAFYFTTDKGVFKFDPQKIAANDHPSPLVFTSLKLSGREVSIGDKTGLLLRNINKLETLTFRYDQNIFTLDFALLSYFRSEHNQYAYKLEGVDEDWQTVKIPSATYMNLPPGEYLFQVRAANGDGYMVTETLELRIVVLPPWWKTWYAYLLYFALTAVLIYVITRFFWLRSSFRKENELYQAKLDFFTNISHEIRTHLSLISGPLERAFQLQKNDTPVQNHLTYAKNNTERLMHLVNELLDFRKMQNGSIKLQVYESDIIKVLQYVLATFEHLAQEKGITSRLEYAGAPVMLWFDVAQMQKVFYNLLSNAYKFTPEGGQVSVIVTETPGAVKIKVIDNGKGIEAGHLRNLFINFFQVNQDNEGYGIGLALSKGIVDQHNGQLIVESKVSTLREKGGTCFTLTLLKDKQHFSVEQIMKAPGSVIRSVTDHPVEIPVLPEYGSVIGRNTLLIIEDNDELRSFIKEVFYGGFTILETDNGQKGLTLANEKIPDLILCDVMMPGLNGLEVCSRLKSEMLTCHIPVILLTARSEVSQVIEGLEKGADDYVVKPFDPRVLELKINNLIKVREDLKQKYSRSVLLEPDDPVVEDLNGEFLSRLKNLVTENLSNVGFGVNEMAFQMGMSVSVLYKKLRSLTGMTVNEFVKTLRMKRALQLLETGRYHVNEVATIVGFEDSKYFSKEFRKVYGKTPSEIKKEGSDVHES